MLYTMTRLDLFKKLANGSYAVEVGTLQGDFAKEILDACQNINLTIVDYWPGKFLQYREKFKATMQCDDSLAGRGWKVLEMPSLDAATWCKNNSKEGFDLIYIDAAHDYASVYADLMAWWPVVKSGGIFAGHDYENKPDDGFWGPIEVRAAVDEWAAKIGLKVNKTDEHNCPSWWVVKP